MSPVGSQIEATRDPVASVIIRTYNSMSTFPRAVESVRSQSVPCELIVVDSGSTDGTVECATQVADRVLHMTHESFSFGGSLNQGAAAATTGVHVALSSHCWFPDNGWVSQAVHHIDAGASATWGSLVDSGGQRLREPLRADLEYLTASPFWGFTNHTSAWRAGTWSAEPFDETLQACEDKEWSWRILREPGSYLVADPALFVASAHRRRKGVRSYFDRLRREVSSYHEILGLPSYGLRDAMRDFTSRRPEDPFVSAGSRPFGRTRMTEVVARFTAPGPRGVR